VIEGGMLLYKVKFDLLVCDEGHLLKNANIKTSTGSERWYLGGRTPAGEWRG